MLAMPSVIEWFSAALIAALLAATVHAPVAPQAADKPIKLTLRPHALRQEVIVEVDASGLASSGTPASLSVALHDSSGKPGTAYALPLDRVLKATGRLSTAGAKPGPCRVRASVRDIANQEMASAEEPLTVPVRPWWLGSKEGITDKVYAPFKPLRVRGSADPAKRAAPPAVLPWDRAYEFASGPLPTAIRARGAAVLASPIRLTCAVNGWPQTWSRSPASVRSATPAVVRLHGTCAAQDLTLTGDVTVEFDGLIRADLTLRAKDGVQVDDLTLEMPVAAQRARYLYQYPGAWGSAKNAGALPKLPWAAPFRPFVWLGDEDRGLCWFTESDGGFRVRDEKQVCELVRRGNAVVLRVRLLEGCEWDGDRRFTFGFQATPIRPNPRDVWDFRITHSGNYGIEKPSGDGRSILDAQADLGVKTICFHEHWTDIQDSTSTTHQSELRSLVTGCHSRGIRLLLYHGYEMSNIAPEFADYSEECLVAPRAGGYARQPPQTAYIVCYRSAWQDYMAAGIARLMDEYGTDGVYLDGTANPWGCGNTLHGCGVERAAGDVRPTYPFFATREVMKRIFNIVKSRKPDGLVNVHQSTCMTIPSVGFATSYWDGEQFGSLERGPRFDQVLPLDAFRCEFMGHQWGVPAEFLCYEKPYTTSEAYAFTLQHDVLVRGGLEQIESRLWKAMDAFGKKTAEWLPYWRNSGVVKTTGEGILAGLYVHAGKDLMLVVSNLGPREADSTVRLDLARLRLSGRSLSASDVLTGEKLPLQNGSLRLPLKSMAWRMLWVR